ncbi:MAG: hypothetical protein MJ131_07970, partial [Lachnospiraceae bacterium]|nr:hypothetical protein [Lachnospiraceae bacterium]
MGHVKSTNPHSKENPWTVQGDLPIPNFNFTLIVEGAMTIPCKSVSAIVRENEFDYIQEGGLNDYVHMRRKGVTKPFTFTVERYAMTFVGSYDPLQEGAEFALPMILLVSPGAGRFEVARRAYVFTGCVVTQKEYGDLNSEQSNLLTEKTTIGYRELIVVSVPKQVNEWAIKEWVMSETKNKGFQGDSDKANRRNDLGIASDEYVTGAKNKYPIPKKAEQRLWEFDEDDYLGSGDRSAKKDMEKNKELIYSSYALKKSPMSEANGGWEKNPRKWGFRKADAKNVSAKADDESSYAIGKPEKGKINPKMWQFVANKYLGTDKNRRMKGERDGNSTYAIGKPKTGKVNPKMWRFIKGNPLGTEANRRMVGDRESNSTYAIGKPEAGKKNVKMWSIKKSEANRRMVGDRESNSTYAIGKPEAGKKNV